MMDMTSSTCNYFLLKLHPRIEHIDHLKSVKTEEHTGMIATVVVL